MKSVAIIVVTYNRLNLLQEEIDSLRKQTFTDCQIIVVNNGSTDNTLDWLNNQSDVITITQENLGGAGGFYTGLKYAAEKGYKYCWVMDDDVICERTALEELFRAYHVKPDIGFVCSKVIGVDGSLMNVPFVDDRAMSNGYPDYIDQIENLMIKVMEATFVSVFISTKVIKELGLPYKEYFIWGDDAEYTRRISNKYPCYLACKSIVIHKRAIQGGLSFYSEKNRNRLRNYFYMFRNQGLNAIKYRQCKRWKLCLSQMYLALYDFFKLRFLQSKIRFRAAFSLIFFNPHIVYPVKE